MDETDAAELLADQDGVISRRQVLELGGADHDIARLVRRRVWARLHDGVFVEHTGTPTWRQRAWGGVLFHAPPALAGASALTAGGLHEVGRDAPIELVVPLGRRLRSPGRVRVTRVADYDAIVMTHRSPPRVRVEHAALTVASAAASEDAAVAVLGEVCRRRRTTPDRLAAALADRSRLPRRALLGEVLDDVGAGAHSAMERRYLRRV